MKFNKKIILAGLFIFIFAMTLRLWNLNAAGRVWDEASLMEKGYTIAELIRKGDFSNSYWYIDTADHPIFAFYFIGIATYGDYLGFDPKAKQLFGSNKPGAPVFKYDLTYGRLSTVLASVLSVLVIYLFSIRYFSFYVSIVSALILSMIPHYLAYSQLVELEAWTMLFYTSSIYVFYLFLDTKKTKYLVLASFLTAATLLIKQSNVLIVIIYLILFFVKYKNNYGYIFKNYIKMGFMTAVFAFLLYPMPWFHFSEYISLNYELWVKERGLVPELIFGRIMGARSFYYILAFLVTTPLLLLLVSSAGVKKIINNKNRWVYLGIIIWFIVPFLLSFFHHRQHMIRYIIQIYAPFAIICALGLEYITDQFKNIKYIKTYAFILLFIYQLIILLNISPYYYNYYNELVGGTRGVFNNNLFFLGWWGEGLKKPGQYILEKAKKGDVIGYVLNPSNTLLKDSSLNYEQYNSDKIYDFVIVNHFAIQRLGFDDKKVKEKYKLIYTEYADGAELVNVYQKK